MTDEEQGAAETAFPTSTSDVAVDLVEQQFDRLMELDASFGVLVEDISGWSVGGHVLHLALSGSSMAVSLLTGRHWDGAPSAPELKDQILRTGIIPAGRAAAPVSVRPESDPAPADIRAAMSKCRARVSRVSSASNEAFIVHPYLGRLTRDELIRFIAIHNRHHLGIINRILAAV